MWLVCDGEYEQWGPVCAFPTEEDANAAAEFYNGWVRRYDNFSYASFDEWRADHPAATKYEPPKPVEPIKFYQVLVTEPDADMAPPFTHRMIHLVGWVCGDCRERGYTGDEDCPHYVERLAATGVGL